MKQRWSDWCLAVVMVAILVGVPFWYYRQQYDYSKRLRVVVPGKLYRAGQMTVEGLGHAIRRYGFRTVVNFQDELPDPLLAPGLPESEFCRQRGVRYVFLSPDLVDTWYMDSRQPEAIDRFLALMDDPATYPVLLHCRAGLHRTGIMTAVYRMEYDGWPLLRAVLELQAQGFGRDPCSVRNLYIAQYLVNYRPRSTAKQATKIKRSLDED
jgi:protein tyrosine phosphatase (PTP) superfamily phosphohydrolase (DUF442 family)